MYTLLTSLLLINLLIAMMSESYEEVQGKAQQMSALARGRGTLAYTLLTGPEDFLVCLKPLLEPCGFALGRPRPPHHVQVHLQDGTAKGRCAPWVEGCIGRRVRGADSHVADVRSLHWMMMMEELDDSPSGMSEATTKKKLVRMEEGQRRLEKNVSTVNKKLDEMMDHLLKQRA